MKHLFILIFAAVFNIVHLYGLQVSSFNPILTGVLEEVGGERITLSEIVPPGTNPHNFEPSADALRSLEDATLIFVMGKGLENYIEMIEGSLQGGQKIIEVGKTIPSIKTDDAASSELYVCCPHHTAGAVDPHWWHNVRHMEKAVRVIESAFKKASPEDASYFAERSRNYRQELRELDQWVEQEVLKIPAKERILVTAHAAFGYFCKEYGFRAVFVEGLHRDTEISARQLAKSIRLLREAGVKSIFPEFGANPKVLSQIAKEVGCSLGSPLDADGNSRDYMQMIRQNVENIVSAMTM